jgi:hypothetical protein
MLVRFLPIRQFLKRQLYSSITRPPPNSNLHGRISCYRGEDHCLDGLNYVELAQRQRHYPEIG